MAGERGGIGGPVPTSPMAVHYDRHPLHPVPGGSSWQQTNGLDEWLQEFADHYDYHRELIQLQINQARYQQYNQPRTGTSEVLLRPLPPLPLRQPQLLPTAETEDAIRGPRSAWHRPQRYYL